VGIAYYKHCTPTGLTKRNSDHCSELSRESSLTLTPFVQLCDFVPSWQNSVSSVKVLHRDSVISIERRAHMLKFIRGRTI
jgi:hypothetical protein